MGGLGPRAPSCFLFSVFQNARPPATPRRLGPPLTERLNGLTKERQILPALSPDAASPRAASLGPLGRIFYSQCGAWAPRTLLFPYFLFRQLGHSAPLGARHDRARALALPRVERRPARDPARDALSPVCRVPCGGRRRGHRSPRAARARCRRSILVARLSRVANARAARSTRNPPPPPFGQASQPLSDLMHSSFT